MNVEVAENREDNQKCKIKCREPYDITECVIGILLCILLESYKAGKRCDQCACATDIYTEKQLSVVGCELREQDR